MSHGEWPQGPGMVGALPRPAWGAVMDMLSSSEGRPGRAWQATVLNLRRTCKALAALVGAGCVGGAGWLSVQATDEAAQLETAATAGLGRALAVLVGLRFPEPGLEVVLARALALAVERGHMVKFVASRDECPPAAARMIEAALIEASREGQLLVADLSDLKAGDTLGLSVDAMAHLSAAELSSQEQGTVARLVGAGALRRVVVWSAKWADMSILASLRKVTLCNCAIEDLSPLADVPSLFVSYSYNIEALPAMRNDVLVLSWCASLTDISGLAGGRVGRLELRTVFRVEDVSAIGAMQPPPRTVILEEMDGVQDVSMLAGVRRLEVSKCPNLDEAAMVTLKGKVGTIRWRE